MHMHPLGSGVRRIRRLALAAGVLLGCCLSSPLSARCQAGSYGQAEALVRSHRWDDGLALALQMLKTAPRDVKLLNLAGLALTGKGDIEQANRYFEKCLAVDPGFVPALKNLAVNEFNLRQYPAAQKHLAAALKLAPHDPVALLYSGELAYRQHSYQRAAEAFDAAGELVFRNPSAAAHLALSDLSIQRRADALAVLDKLAPDQVEPQSQFALGLKLEQLGMAERAIPFLEAVRARYPDSYDIGFDLMLACIESKQNSRAIDVARDMIARGRETSELNNVLAEAYEADNQIQPAVDALRRAIALDPADEDNYLDFASLCMNQRSLQAGMTVVQVGLDSHPNSDRLIFMRGVLYAMQDEFEKAEQDFKRAADLAPQKDLGYVGLGVSFLETGHDAQAIEILRKRLRERPDDASLLYLLGEALVRSGAAAGSPAFAEAQASLEKSVRLNPGLCLPHVSLGSIYLDEDRPADAVVQFEKARAIDPRERSAYSHLAVAYRRLGQPDKAREVLNALKDVIERERENTRERMKTEGGSEADKAP